MPAAIGKNPDSTLITVGPPSAHPRTGHGHGPDTDQGTAGEMRPVLVVDSPVF